MRSEKQKRIGIDARFYGEAGPGRYTKNILTHLERIDGLNRYVVFLRPQGFNAYKPENPNFEKVLADYKWYSFDEQFRFLFKILKYKLDLLYVPHFNIPVLYPGKLVTAIPDLIMHTFSTEKGTTLFKPYFKLKKLVYKLVFKWAVVKSKKIIVPAQTVLEDFLKYYPQTSKDKYVIAQEGIDPDIKIADVSRGYEVLDKFGINKPFLLYISSMYEHKNVPRLIQAFEVLIKKYNYNGQLVLVGKKDKFSENISQLVFSMGLGERVLLPGMREYITDEETCGMRKECEAYIFPSLKEGFSLTPMEAQYFGKACVISDIPIHKEVYSDSVLYFDPLNIDDMAEKINLLITDADLRQDLINKGYKNIMKYSWDKTADQTLGVFNEILQNS
ncbi:glycosyltransferase family 4 protein [Patescibacteria group bacterium]|nr:glycosyltransferase family 4 protein [Patescibacteria group bacterium]MBU1953007.1 glycosyltransferase family 4 protein [Patescibacteria group bacterium]